jgi:hypothetical protein
MKADYDSGGVAQNLNYLNLTMTNVGMPIVIYSYYLSHGTPDNITTATVLDTNAAPVTSSTPIWRDITFSNLYINAASDIGGIIWGRTEMFVSNLTLIRVTDNAPKAFDIYNAWNVKLIDSQFNLASGNTFTLCNAGVTISNTTPAGKTVTIGGANSTNSIALYNAPASLSSTNAYAATPITVGGGTLTNGTNLILPAATTQNFALGTSSGKIAVGGNLTLNSTINITAAAGFTATNYTLFTYTGTLGGTPKLGATPAGYNCSLNTAMAGQVRLVVSNSVVALPPSFGNISTATGGGFSVSGTGGAANGNYYLLSSTNAALPLNQWTRIATNQFDGSGNFAFTNSPAPGLPQLFYQLQLQ